MKRRSPKGSMFLRMLVRAAMLRKGRAASALLAVTVSAAAATALLNLFGDVQGKLRSEFRKFGANIIVEKADGRPFSSDELQGILSHVQGRGLAVPFTYVVARTDRDQPVMVAGTEFELARELNLWWDVSSWPQAPGEALIGARAAKAILSNAGKLNLHFAGRTIQLLPSGKLSTGAGEDDRVYISLADFQQWTGLGPSVLEVSATGGPNERSSLLQHLRQDFPSVTVRAVRQVAESESNVLGKTRSTVLVSSAFIIFTAALCVLATLMGWVFDRRRDFAIMKALGASDRLIALFVAGEGIVLGAAGAVLGYLGGIGVAAWIGRVNFHAPVAPRLDVFPVVLAGCIAVTLLATVLPLRLLRRIEPAMILRGE